MILRQNALADKAAQRVNMGKYITTGKFKPDGKGGLIQTESDLKHLKNYLVNIETHKKVFIM